jgi:hypothetical protein
MVKRSYYRQWRLHKIILIGRREEKTSSAFSGIKHDIDTEVFANSVYE